MAKKQTFDYTKLLMFVIPLVIAVGTYFVLQYRVDAAEKKIEKVEIEQSEDDKEYQQLQIQQTQIQAKVEGSYELLKDLKDAVKDLSKK